MSSATKRSLRSAICEIFALCSQDVCGRNGRLYYLFWIILTLSVPLVILVQILYYIFIPLDMVDLHLGSGRFCIPMY